MMSPPQAAAVIVAAGRGERLGATIPKAVVAGAPGVPPPRTRRPGAGFAPRGAAQTPHTRAPARGGGARTPRRPPAPRGRGGRPPGQGRGFLGGRRAGCGAGAWGPRGGGPNPPPEIGGSGSPPISTWPRRTPD